MLYSTIATLKIGMDLLSEENVQIDSLTGHGGLFKTPVVGQKYLAAACGAPVTIMKTAGEGGPYGMALLAAYMIYSKNCSTLEEFLSTYVFASAESSVLQPEKSDIEGFEKYIKTYKQGINVESAAVKYL
jgi:sugar (pentulose or hexulose) kinase